ncbi:unnamed protein product [Cuscuta campestris]|uniref:65-kDa microtubule-associated protein 3 n=1 Tax=Cuscuta campestris TaxID=132261 RepID=A0A484LH98_9ASTE|nr:unnamed protein product [Cuscuta campestris]
METACGSLMSELKKMWDDIGENEVERDKILYQLEQECLKVYKRKVDEASRNCAQLRQAIAESEAELARICAALGEQPVNPRPKSSSLKMELEAIRPQLQEMKHRKLERERQFADVMNAIDIVLEELGLSRKEFPNVIALDESDMSLRRLEEMKGHLLSLQAKKSDRLKQVLHLLESLNSLCLVLGIDFRNTVVEIHPTLDGSYASKSVSAQTIDRLTAVIHKLREVKIQRLNMVQDLATTMVELWNLMDTPVEEQHPFLSVTRTIAASESEITEPDALSLQFIKSAEVEVSRLLELKTSKLKEVLLKKRLALEEICRKAHIVLDADQSTEFSLEAIESGAIDPSYLLEQIEIKISTLKEEAFSRREILEKVDKWLTACDEESWLEEYNRDDNRYNGGRGTHLILKRAEKARALVNKIPGMVDILTSKAKSWERERGVPFLYDGVSLLSMLEQYGLVKQGKELERQRQRDQKRLQGQLIAEQEALFGAKPSPSPSVKKNLGGGGNNKRYSMGGAMLQTPYAERSALSIHTMKKKNPVKQPALANVTQNFVAHSSGKRESSIHAKQQHSINISNPNRNPLSPLSSLSFNTNSPNIIIPRNEDETPPSSLMTTPVKNVCGGMIGGGGGYTTPKNIMPMRTPSTPPSAASIAMQTAATPAAAAASLAADDDDYVEYSFEEKRAGFFIPRLQQIH